MQSEAERIIEELKARGYRMTPQRILLTRLMLETVERHPSLRELHEEAQKILPGTGISTIYNTIMMLESSGVLRVFYLDGKLYIDRHRPHVNVICKQEGSIKDVDGDSVKEITSFLSKRGIKMKDPLVLIIGECEDQQIPHEPAEL
ncbi:MAG: transcriptional repressor [Acidilobaceae archaeon]|nr:transcriptional repressor [Acidilobaceae archaeon]